MVGICNFDEAFGKEDTLIPYQFELKKINKNILTIIFIYFFIQSFNSDVNVV